MHLSLAKMTLRLLCAALFGSLLGLERERRDQPAGLRTHAIVCLGAALAMLVSAHGFVDVVGVRGVVLDPSRVAGQVVSGIGFLGAGVIFAESARIRGLTTAAGLWAVGAIGLACGGGMLGIAAVATVLALIILGPLKGLEERRLRRRGDEDKAAGD